MRRLVWIVLAAMAGMAGGCADDTALYTSPKYVPGYTPPGSSATALARDKQQERDPNVDWRQR